MRDAVALLDAVLLQHVGEAADVPVELVVGNLAVVIGIVALPDDRRLVAALLQVPVDAIVGNVELPVLEPFDRDLAGERGVLDLLVGLEPVDALAVLAPELVRVPDAVGVPFEVSLVVDQRVLLPSRLDAMNVDLRHAIPLHDDLHRLEATGAARPVRFRAHYYHSGCGSNIRRSQPAPPQRRHAPTLGICC